MKLSSVKNTDKSKSMSAEEKTPQLTATSEASGSSMHKTQRRIITLPKSGHECTLILQKFDPDELPVASINKRMQRYVNENNLKIQSLKSKIEKEGQLEPGLVRIVDGNPELIYGSRRRFVISLINKERTLKGDEPLKFEAWRGNNISDSDAKRLADSENDDKEPISPYEEGKSYARMRDEDGMEPDVIAAIEEVSVETVRGRLRISHIDERFIDLLPSPMDITQTQGTSLVALINKTTVKKQDLFLEEHSGSQFELMKDLVSEFKTFTQQKAKKAKPIEFKKSKKLKAKMTPNRDDKTKFKIDVFNMTEEQKEEMVMLLESWIE